MFGQQITQLTYYLLSQQPHMQELQKYKACNTVALMFWATLERSNHVAMPAGKTRLTELSKLVTTA
jgi:hypothetical protein